MKPAVTRLKFFQCIRLTIFFFICTVQNNSFLMNFYQIPIKKISFIYFPAVKAPPSTGNKTPVKNEAESSTKN